jgi:ubiquinone/menaquinone biosynthesis C-methylase UbiE
VTTQDVAREGGMHWGDDVACTYFQQAELDLDRHWDSLIFPFIGMLSFDTVLDIAAGHGRNAAKLSAYAKRIICVDINPDNVCYMKQRFSVDRRFTIILNDGVSLQAVNDGAVDLAYSFDSMVHFDLRVITAYLEECMRVLRVGGHAFIHHSNFSGNPGGDFRRNPHWRNYMSSELFMHLACCAGFSVLSTQTIAWGGIPDLDGLALLQKV